MQVVIQEIRVLRFCISKKLPGHPDAITLENHILGTKDAYMLYSTISFLDFYFPLFMCTRMNAQGSSMKLISQLPKSCALNVHH